MVHRADEVFDAEENHFMVHHDHERGTLIDAERNDIGGRFPGFNARYKVGITKPLYHVT
jgi:hypothetical protein